jgi:hypothetical protein
MSELLDPLSLVWMSLDDPGMAFSHIELARYIPEQVEALKRSKILIETTPTDVVGCPECDGRHSEEVIRTSGANGAVGFWISCHEAGRVKIEAGELVRWKVDLDVLARVIKEGLGITQGHRVSQPLPGRVWRLGTTRPDKRETREVYLVASADRLTASDLVGLTKDGNRPILLHGSGVQALDFGDQRPYLMALKSALLWEQDRVAIDWGFLHSVISENDQAARRSGSRLVNKIQDKVAPIVRALIKSVDRDALILNLHFQESMGIPQIEGEMKDRGVPTSRATIYRALAKGKELAKKDSRMAKLSNLTTPKSQHRDRKNAPIRGAQPIEEE